jgi:glycopeptide antibiotics resistance protein
MPVDSGSGERHPVNAWWRPLGDDRIALLAAMAMVAAFLYGSLLPFDLHRPDALNPITWLQQIRRTSWAQTSGTDLAVNIVVGTLLGFLLTGALRTGRGKHLNAGVAVLVVVCAATTLSTAVEMLQFLSPSRTASWNDVLGQVLGVVVGAVAWNPIGDRLLRWLHALANERESLSFAASVLQLYLPLYVLIQLTPLEKDLAVKYANSRMLLLPVTRYFEFTFPALRNVLGDVLLSVPIGALSVLAWVPKGTHRSVRHAVLLGGSIVVAVETIHGAIWSHYASLIDIVSGSMGTAIGALAAVTWARSRVTGADRQSRRRLLVLLLIVWILMMMVEYWYPFDFDVAPELTRQRLAHFPWIPFASYYPSYASAPLDGIRELLSRFLLAIPLGVLVRSALPDAREGWLSAVLTTGVATILMLLIAVGELFLPAGYPDTTEVALGVIGAAVGGAIATAFARCNVAASPAMC